MRLNLKKKTLPYIIISGLMQTTHSAEIEEAATQHQDLTAIKELRKHFSRRFLEITPDNIQIIQPYTMMHESSFDEYTGGVYVKQWKTSTEIETLREFLFKFTRITKLKIEPIWDRNDADIAGTISQSVQFYGDLGELSIAGCALTNSHMEDILESVPNPDKLRILDIRNNNLTITILPRIQEKFTQLRDLKTELYEEVAKKQQTKEELERQYQLTIVRPIGIPIPKIARGYEEEYRLFYNGKLIYNPNNGNPRIELPIAALANPLEGRFDLSSCGHAGAYLGINTGYRERKREIVNPSTLQIWFVPKFLVERELETTAAHFRPIMSQWTAPVGIFWTWGDWDIWEKFDYLVTSDVNTLSSVSLDRIALNWWNGEHRSRKIAYNQLNSYEWSYFCREHGSFYMELS